MQGTVISIAIAVGDAVPAGASGCRDGSHEDGTRHPGRCRRHRRAPFMSSPATSSGKTSSLLTLEPSGGCGAGRWAARMSSTSMPFARIWPRCWQRRALTRDAARPEPSSAGTRPTIGPRARTSTTWSTPARSSSTAPLDHRGAAASADARRSARRTRRPMASSPGVGRVNGEHVPATAHRRRRDRRYDYTVLRRNAGRAEPLEDRPDPRARRGRALPVVLFAEGGGGRPGDDRLCAACIAVSTPFHHFGAALGARAAGRHRLGPLLRRQRRAARLLRRDHRDRGLAHRHGRPGDDRGRRPRRVHARGDRPDATCRRATASSTSLVADEAEAVAVAKRYLVLLPGRRSRLGLRRSAAHAPSSCPRTGCAPTTCATCIATLADDRLGARAAPRRSGHGMMTALIRARGPAARRRSPTTRHHLGGAIDRRRRRQGAALHAAADAFDDCPIRLLCDTPGIMVGPEAEKTALVAPRQRACS